MKVSSKVAAVAALATAANAANHHQHQHARFHQHEARAVDTVIVNDVAVKYIFDGQEVPFNQVCEGLANGTFAWNAGAGDKPNCSPNAPAPSTSSSAAPTTTPKPAVFLAESSTSSSSSVKPTSSSAAPSAASSPAANSNIGSSVSGSLMSLLANNPGVSKPFPDGQLPCTFSSLQNYGAVPLDYLGFGGFSTIQSVTGNLMSSIGITQVQQGGNGDYYSYSCPSGYQKTQWPPQNTGNTVGGVLCEDGVFKLTNPSYSTLCTPGAGNVDVQSSLPQVACICGTDYPGSESETVPNVVQPGGSTPLAIQNTGTYFKHQGAGTSLEYYMNPLGVTVDNACTWGTNPAGTNQIGQGNWAPIVLGLGTDEAGEMAYIGLQSAEQVLNTFQGNEGQLTLLNYNIKISGSNGQTCEYRLENGKGNFYNNGVLSGSMGQYLAGGSVPGVTCAFPASSQITAALTMP